MDFLPILFFVSNVLIVLAVLYLMYKFWRAIIVFAWSLIQPFVTMRNVVLVVCLFTPASPLASLILVIQSIRKG